MSRAAEIRSKSRTQSRKGPNPQVAAGTVGSLTGNRLLAVLSGLLGAATVVIYLPVVGHSFIVLDDHDYVTGNQHVQGGLSWSTIKWAFTSTEAANWHPLTWLSHALDCQFFALNPAGHHLDNVLIHAVNGALLFLLLAWVTKRVGPSLLVAALFALHPINVESVAWVAERKNVLSTFFFFLAIGAYGWYARKASWRRYLAVAALFAAGLMAKPMVITLPFVLLLLDYWPLERIADGENGAAAANGIPKAGLGRLLLEKAPLLFFSAASAWITLKAQHSVVRTIEEFSFAARIENAMVSYALYLWKMLWPAQLALYPHAVSTPPAWHWILSAAVLIGVTAVVAVYRRKRYLAVGWLWFLGTLIPVIGLVQVGEFAMADRYGYVPLIGIFVMVAWSVADWADEKKIRTAWRVVPAAGVLLALAWVSHRQMSYWKSDYDLWSHALAVEENPFAENAVGVALLNPESQMTRGDVESFATAQDRLEEARQHFEITLGAYRQLAKQNPKVYLSYLAEILDNVCAMDRVQKRVAEAHDCFDEALQTYRQLAEENPGKYQPYMANILNYLGFLNQSQRRMEESRSDYQEALAIFQKLAEGNAQYAGDVEKTKASLEELGRQMGR